MSTELRVGDATVRPEEHKIEREGRTVRLRPKSVEVLQQLVEHPGEVCLREQLLRAVWAGAHVGEEVLTQAIAELRRAFGDSGRESKVIETIPRAGYRLVAPVEPKVGSSGMSLVASRMVGRSAAWSRVRHSLDEVQGGKGQLLLVAGEPGIGKTRLADEALAEAGRTGFLAVAGRCSEDETLALLPFVEIFERMARTLPRERLRALLGDLGPEVARLVPEIERRLPDLPPSVELPAEQRRRYLFNAIVEVLERASLRSPVCLVIDDLQWADSTTVDLLLHMARELGRTRVLMIGTYRDTELSRERPFLLGLQELTRQRLADRIELAGLGTEDVAAMLESLAGARPPSGVAESFVDQTRGNPFFIEELFHHLQDQGSLARTGDGDTVGALAEGEAPEGVRLVIQRRTARLRRGTRRLLSVAAVAGRSFDPEVVRKVLEIETDELVDLLSEAEGARLVAPREDDNRNSYQFEHDLIRHALTGELPSARRRQLHLWIANALRELSPEPGRSDADIVRHLIGAGHLVPAGEVVRFSGSAGVQALHSTAFEEARGHFERALDLVSDRDDGERAELLYYLGCSLRAIGRWDDSWQAWTEALALQEERGASRAAVLTIEQMTLVALWAANWSAVVALAERGLIHTGAETAGAERSLFLARQGLALSMDGEHRKADSRFRLAARLAEESGDDAALGTVFMHRCCALNFRLESGAAVEAGERAVALLRGTPKLWEFAPALSWLQVALLSSGRWQEIDAYTSEVERMSERSGHEGALLFSEQAISWRQLLMYGDLAAFAEGCNRRRDMAVRVTRDPSGAMIGIDLALARFWQGDWNGAISALEVRDEQSAFFSPYRLAARLRILCYHDPDSARRLLEEHAKVTDAEPNDAGGWALVLAVIESQLVLDGHRSASRYPMVLAARERIDAVLLLWSETLVEKGLALAATSDREWTAAERHFKQALVQVTDPACTNRIEHAEVLRWYSWMLLSRDTAQDRRRARHLLAEARDLYVELEMPRHFALAESLAEQVG